MKVGDKEWRERAARVVCDARRLIDHDFARYLANEIKRAIRERAGEDCDVHR